MTVKTKLCFILIIIFFCFECLSNVNHGDYDSSAILVLVFTKSALNCESFCEVVCWEVFVEEISNLAVESGGVVLGGNSVTNTLLHTNNQLFLLINTCQSW